MNKFRAIIALLMGVNAGMNIVSNIWSPSSEKIPMAIFYCAIAAIWIIQIKEPQVKEEMKDKTPLIEK